jgi:hypothetical protein
MPGHQRNHGIRCLARFEVAQLELGFVARLGQRIAPSQARRISRAGCTSRACHTPQGADTTLGGRGRAVRAVGSPAVEPLSVVEDCIQGRDDLRRVAARVVALQQRALQAFQHKSLGRGEHPRVGIAEAVDALFGIADDEHRRRPLTAGTAARHPRRTRASRASTCHCSGLVSWNSSISKCCTRWSSRSCTQPASSVSPSRASATRSRSAMSTRPRWRLSAAYSTAARGSGAASHRGPRARPAAVACDG